MPVRRLAAAVLVSFLALTCAAAAEPAPFPDLHWRLLGPFRGGRVLAVTGVPGEPEHFYFGSVDGGIWETANAGRTWRPIFDGQPIGSIGALAVAPSNPRLLYAGTGEADMRSDIAQGDGMYRSADGGRTWTHIGLADSQQIGRVLVDPRNPDRVYVAALGHPYGPNAERGVFRSLDGGRSWKKVLGKGDDTGAIDLAFEPGHPEVLYAALWQTRRTPWEVYPPSSGPGSGLYKSSDGGDTWAPVGKGLPAKPGRIGIAVAPSRPERVYAIVDALEGGGLYRSDDAGATWTKTSGDARIWGRGWYFGGITVEPQNPDVVYSCNTAVFRSTDGGRTFVPVKGAPGGTTTTSCGSIPRSRSAGCSGSTRGPWSRSTAGRPGAPGTTSRPVSSTMSSPTTASPTGSTARSRTPGRPASPAGPTATTASTSPSSGRRRRAARATTSPPIRAIRTSSSAAGWTGSTSRPARPARSTPPSPIPASTGTPGPCRSSSRRAIRAGSTSPTSASSAPSTAAPTGRRSPPT